MRDQLPDRTRQLLDGELTLETTYKAIGSVAFTCHGHDHGFEAFADLLWQSALGWDFFEENNLKSRGQFDKQIRRAWDYAENNFDYGYRERSVRERLGHLLARIQAAPWPGRGGSSERAVAVALVSLGHEVNRYTVNASVRDLAGRAKISKSTVSKALKRLAEKELFSARTTGVSGQSDLFRLDLEWKSLLPIGGHTELFGAQTTLYVPVLVTTEHPAFTQAALGKSAGRIWEFLLCHAPEGGATVAEIQTATGISSNTVRAQLKRMTSNDLTVKNGQRGARYTVHADADLDRVAKDYGTSDWEDRTAQRYEKERSGYAEYLRQTEMKRVHEHEHEHEADADSPRIEAERRWMDDAVLEEQAVA